MDEPTAALSETECERLFKIIRELAQSGVAIAYVSHRLDEIEELSQRVTVFKDGDVAGRFDRGSYGRRDLVLGITGSESLAPRLPPVAVDAEAPVTFQVEHLSNGVNVHDVSFKVRRGEILGLAGLVGSGRSETFTQILGASKMLSGQMILNGKPYRPTSVKRAVAAGVALVPEERRSQALVMSDTVKNNISLGNWKRMRVLRGFGLISDRKAGLVSDAMVKKLSIKASTTDVPVSTLSGGNQQKVVFGRWVARDSKLLLLDEPTRGVDIGARQHIWENVESLAVEGTAVVVASSELAELALCHRVVVIVEGKTVAEIQGPGVTEQEMLDAIYNYQMEEEA
jgi:ribose transport system ATP-binding protein